MKFSRKNFLILGSLLPALSFCMNTFSQIPANTTITGLVSDAKTGDPLPFVSVLLKGTTVGTITNNDGKYFILH